MYKCLYHLNELVVGTSDEFELLLATWVLVRVIEQGEFVILLFDFTDGLGR